MALSVKERKEHREAGRQRELDQMSVAKRVVRRYTNGRPPASEFRSPLAAVAAARTFQHELEMALADETHGTRPRRGDIAVAVGYVSPDLSLLGFTPLFAPGEEAKIERALTGNIPLGLIFGVAERPAAKGGGEIEMGARPFHSTKQTESWLAELALSVKSEFEIDRLERQ